MNKSEFEEIPFLLEKMKSTWGKINSTTFKGNRVDPFTIPSIFMFPLRDGMFDFGDPCDNPSKKFGAAFANLIKILYKHPSFTKFITN